MVVDGTGQGAAALTTYRYFDCVARPPGYGIDASVACMVSVADLDNLRVDDWPAGMPRVQERHLPLLALGHGHQGLPGKVPSLSHHMLLDHGGPTERVVLFNNCVRLCLTDLGTDMGLVNSAEVVSQPIRDVGVRWRRLTRGGSHMHFKFLDDSTCWFVSCRRV